MFYENTDKTQAQLIADYLREHGEIDKPTAREVCGTDYLRGVIRLLRESGYEIQTCVERRTYYRLIAAPAAKENK